MGPVNCRQWVVRFLLYEEFCFEFHRVKKLCREMGFPGIFQFQFFQFDFSVLLSLCFLLKYLYINYLCNL